MKRQRLCVRPRLLKDNDSCADSKSLSSASAGATVKGMATVTIPEGRFLEKTVTFSREALEHYCFRERNPFTFAEVDGLTIKGFTTLDGGKHVRQVLKSLKRIQRPNGQQAYWIKLWQWISNQNRRISVNELLRWQGTNPIFFVQILFSIFQLVGVLSPTAKDRWKTYNTRKLLWGSRLSSRSSASAGASDKSLPLGNASSPRPRVTCYSSHCGMHS